MVWKRSSNIRRRDNIIFVIISFHEGCSVKRFCKFFWRVVREGVIVKLLLNIYPNVDA